jgi:hypothetical protein
MILDPSEAELGMKIMSVVSSPAIQVNWVKLSDKQIKLSIQDEEQRIVFGPALIPDLPIKRTILDEVFYVSIDRENILHTAIKFQKDGIANKIDTNHDNQLLQGITIFESFLTDEKRVQAVKGFEELPVGTWFITAKVNNDQVWEKIKTGELNGFSIDALFKFEKAETLDTPTIEGAIREILNTL